jgi:hypothetical protein
VKVQTLAYQRERELKGFTIYLEADDSISSLPLEMEPVPAGGQRGSGGSSRNVEGRLVDYIYSDGTITGQFKLTARSASITGKFETTWTPPVTDPAAKPELVSKPACLNLDIWIHVLSNPAPLPELGGTLLVYGRILNDNQPPSPDNYGVLFTDLPGTQRRIFGKGTTPSASADGRLLAYSWIDGIHLVETASGKDNLIAGLMPDDSTPKLSPDGNRLAFIRQTDMNLYLVNIDGSGLRQITDTPSIQEYTHGWSTDGTRLLYLKIEPGAQSLMAKNITNGQETTLVTIQGNESLMAISPDGKTLAYSGPVRGRMMGGIYLAPLDGSSAPRLLAQVEPWMVGAPVWSPDGQWLLVSIANTDSFKPESTSALINISSCQTIPIPSFEGTAQEWLK